MVVGYYADSLGLSRPGYVGLHERYIYLFEQWLRKSQEEEVFVINRARSAFTIDKLFQVYKEDRDYISERKDILIIHEGVCDCAPRPVPLWLRRIISKLPAFLKNRIISFLHTRRAWLLKHGFANYLIDAATYERILREWLLLATKDFERIYMLTIAPTNEEIENHSPGFQKSISKYNAVIRKIIAEINAPNLILIDMHSILSAQPELDDYVIKEDGHHITSRAHRLIADNLIENEMALRTHA